ncbi:MAG: T9SS type A sorting domain-containing protein, partial [Bacteroidales bacterium]|nr:T9SS type A sorting domain-containing protein [Bacteroidales bacterium]
AQFAAHSTIDLTGLAQGAYFVRIATEQTTAIRKLIVR